MGKSIFKSKTFWVNILGAVGIATDQTLGAGLDGDQIAAILVAVNIILRFFTRQPVTIK